MNSHRSLSALLALLLLLSCCCIVQAASTTTSTSTSTSTLPLILPMEEPVRLDNICCTLESLLHPVDADKVAQDYTDALLNEYFGVQVRCKTCVSLRSGPDSGQFLCLAQDGDLFRLLGAADGWFKVVSDGMVGYLSAEYADLLVYDDCEELSAVSTVQEDLVAEALTWLGTRYRYGGSSRSGTDCSGFTMAVFSQFGYSLIHGAGDQYAQSTSVTPQERDIGDLVFFNWGYGIAHVGIYLGGGTFIHASTSNGVIISSLYESYYANGYVGAGRILPD